MKKKELIAIIKEQHLRDVESLIDLLEANIPDDEPEKEIE